MKVSRGVSYVWIGCSRDQRTKLDFSIGDNKVRSIGFIFDTNRFIEELEQLLGVHQGGVNGAIDRSEHVQGFIELNEVCDKDDEVASGALSMCYSQSHDDRSNEETKGLRGVRRRQRSTQE